MGWTKEQQRIIDSRDASILVSAAAGSGKTAVLVERILQKIMDEENPCDIDEFLVVTFTKLAAAQMKEKLEKNIEKALLEQPDNEHLMKQLHLVNRADITTIDSFCLKLVKENFGMLNLDSAFTIADPGMVKLMQNEVLDRLFEDKFKLDKEDSVRQEFEMLLDIFGSTTGDEKLRDMILAIYDTASGFSRIDEWLENAEHAYDCESAAELEGLPWMRLMIKEIKSKVRDASKDADRVLCICETEAGPAHYVAAIKKDLETFEKILAADSYDEIRAAMSDKWPVLGRAKKADVFDKDCAETCKTIRNTYKKLVDSVKPKKQTEEIIAELAELKAVIMPLIRLTREFVLAFDDMKQGRKMLTFSDVEHLAFRLVCDGYDENRTAIASKVGQSISERYREIYIDEYQDSNFLQEDILTAVSRYWKNEPNMFMVGDVKQSIYRFRNARPDIFLGKYKRFKDEGNEIKIELRNNFRARDVVLNPVNYFFYRLMGEDLGGIEYNEDIALVPTKYFPEPDDVIKDRISQSSELIIVDTNNVDEEGELKEEIAVLTDEEINLDKVTLEANVIADRIRELVDPALGTYIYDERLDEYRLAKYQDIVILLRSMKNYGEIIYNVLSARGIPVYLEETKGYFNAVEIRTIISLLSVVDNSKNDIPLAAVLLSPMAGIDESELALICAYAAAKELKSKYLYDKCRCYVLDVENEISGKLSRIFDIVDKLKEMRKTESIADLIYNALEMTGYYEYASAMPMGKRRKANIDMLIEKARSYENGYYKGLFNFLRYMEKLKLNDMDFGEAGVFGSEENVVSITSMHKSKGLEYPIVFVSGLGKQYNEMDVKEDFIIHSDYYIAGKVMKQDKRYKSRSAMWEAFRTLIYSDMVGEELRVLYVALTRAKEKLIMTGTEKDVDGVMNKISALSDVSGVMLPYSVRRDTKSFLQLILSTLQGYDDIKKDFEPFRLETKIVNRAEALKGAAQQEIKKNIDIEILRQMALSREQDELYECYRQRFEKTYDYDVLTKIQSKMSISEIKKMKAFDGAGFDIDEAGNAVLNPDIAQRLSENLPVGEAEPFAEAAGEIPPDGEVTPAGDADVLANAAGTVPAEASKEASAISEKKMSGTEYGTLVHKIMELVNFRECLLADDGISYIRDFLKSLVSDNIIEAYEAKRLSPYKIYKMISSPLGRRMAKADEENVLFKEQQFSVGIPVREIYEKDERLQNIQDVVVVQGIVDAFFYEDDEIVVMDYKTDNASEEELIGRYKEQLRYYASTVERLTGKHVKEKLMYSFGLGRAVPVL